MRMTHLEAARRMAWSFLNGTSRWDVTTALQKSDAGTMQAALAALDSAVHTQPQQGRSPFSQMLSHAKLQVLAAANDPTARAVAQASLFTAQCLLFTSKRTCEALLDYWCICSIIYCFGGSLKLRS